MRGPPASLRPLAPQPEPARGLVELRGRVGDEVRPAPPPPANACVVDVDGHSTFAFILTRSQAEFITHDTMKLEGKVALVTGGARGVGRGVCFAPPAEGAAAAADYRPRGAQAQGGVEGILGQG